MALGACLQFLYAGLLPEDRSAKIVDLACGAGKLLYFFKRMGYHNISGVDISPEQVELARQTTPDVQKANYIDYLESHPEVFDLITCLPGYRRGFP